MTQKKLTLGPLTMPHMSWELPVYNTTSELLVYMNQHLNAFNVLGALKNCINYWAKEEHSLLKLLLPAHRLVSPPVLYVRQWLLKNSLLNRTHLWMANFACLYM